MFKKYPILSIEDGLAEDDGDGWKLLMETLGGKFQIVGDDLFVTNRKRPERGIKLGVANSILIKLHQLGTLTETLERIQCAREARYTTVISHRSGETEDTGMADIAVTENCGQIMGGAISRTERPAKYSQLLRIEEAPGDDRRLPGEIRALFDPGKEIKDLRKAAPHGHHSQSLSSQEAAEASSPVEKAEHLVDPRLVLPLLGEQPGKEAAVFGVGEPRHDIAVPFLHLLLDLPDLQAILPEQPISKHRSPPSGPSRAAPPAS